MRIKDGILEIENSPSLRKTKRSDKVKLTKGAISMSEMKIYEPSKQLCYVIESDGDSWFAHYDDFTNVAESDEVAFGNTPKEALQKFIDSRVTHHE